MPRAVGRDPKTSVVLPRRKGQPRPQERYKILRRVGVLFPSRSGGSVSSVQQHMSRLPRDLGARHTHYEARISESAGGGHRLYPLGTDLNSSCTDGSTGTAERREIGQDLSFVTTAPLHRPSPRGWS